MGLSSCQSAAYHMPRSSPFYPGSYLDAPTSSQQTPTTLPLETKVCEEETTHGPNASFLDFVLPAALVQPSEPLKEYGPHLFEMVQPSQQDPQATSTLANRLPRSNYGHSQILGVPFTVSSTGRSEYDTSSDFSSDNVEQEGFWMVDATSGDSQQRIHLGKAGRALKKLFLESDNSVARAYTAGMRGLSSATDRPVQFAFGEGSSTLVNLSLDTRKASLELGINFDKYKFDSIAFKTEYAVFDRNDEQGELALGIFFTHKCASRKNIVPYLSYR